MTPCGRRRPCCGPYRDAAPARGRRHDAGEPAALAQQAAELAQELQAATTQARIRLELAQDDDRLARSAGIRQRIEAQSARSRTWEQLGELIGSADGKKFRNFAQQLTLDLLLGANAHLQGSRAATASSACATAWACWWSTRTWGDELRSVHSLSGGESSWSRSRSRSGWHRCPRTGCGSSRSSSTRASGSLDAESLNVAIDALDRLQTMGRKVGVISHVQEMTERIGVRVRVARLSGGASRIVVEGR